MKPSVSSKFAITATVGVGMNPLHAAVDPVTHRVFVANEIRLGRKVVVKVLSPELAAGISAERFEREIRMAASLQQAYLSDALNQMAAEGVPLVPVYIDGRWREIDTEEDLSRAHAVVNGWG